MEPRLSIVVPLLNEFAILPQLIEQLESLDAHQLIIVDGGSQDGSSAWLASNWCQPESSNTLSQSRLLLTSAKGRANQMNTGAASAIGDVLLFLHADTILPLSAKKEIFDAINMERLWGRFNVSFSDDQSVSMKVVAWFINWRSRLTGIATGDQAIFIQAHLFRQLNGFANIPLMEDVEMSKRLKQHCQPYCSTAQVKTSARRWRKNGVVKTILFMWVLRLGYLIGVPSQRLAKIYRSVR